MTIIIVLKKTIVKEIIVIVMITIIAIPAILMIRLDFLNPIPKNNLLSRYVIYLADTPGNMS